ncbi:MAG: hypothetical protein F6K00_16940 [Leptolyngbya sp. SIOISBB]|nr:hypothetical protein [Leptolyngbya sp. SIOISBB]
MTYANRPFRLCRLALMSFAGCIAVLGLTLSGCAGTPNNVGTANAPLTADAPYEARLANYLTEQGVAMYGAFWCPHCEDQKAMFGDAVDRVPYVECDPEGDNAQPELCMAKEIKGYPTWEINGEFYPGARSLEELAQLSGFTEP